MLNLSFPFMILFNFTRITASERYWRHSCFSFASRISFAVMVLFARSCDAKHLAKAAFSELVHFFLPLASKTCDSKKKMKAYPSKSLIMSHLQYFNSRATLKLTSYITCLSQIQARACCNFVIIPWMIWFWQLVSANKQTNEQSKVTAWYTPNDKGLTI